MKNTVRMILANSPGWKDSGPRWIQILAPKSASRDGKNAGAASRTSATAIEMYV